MDLPVRSFLSAGQHACKTKPLFASGAVKGLAIAILEILYTRLPLSRGEHASICKEIGVTISTMATVELNPVVFGGATMMIAFLAMAGYKVCCHHAGALHLDVDPPTLISSFGNPFDIRT